MLDAGLLDILPKHHQMHSCDKVVFSKEQKATTAAPFGHLHQPQAVAEGSRQVFEQTKIAAASASFVLVLGGDHSIAIGSIAAMASVYPDIAIIWFDAHADINMAMGSESGKLHGCPVSFLLGHKDSVDAPGFDWFRQETDAHAKKTIYDSCHASFLTPNRIGYLGLRDVDPPEAITLTKHNIFTAYMKDIRSIGLDECIKRLLSRIDPENKRPFHLSFDVDGMDPEFAPSTGTPVPGGLTLDEAIHVVDCVKKTGRLLSMDIVEVNPKLGTPEEASRTLKSTLDIIKAAIQQ